MLDLRRLFIAGAALSVACPLFAGSPAHETLPRAYSPHFDGTPSIAQSPVDGSTWAAWSYRSGREFDLAVASRGSDGLWSEPTFIGSLDGIDQAEPAMLFDSGGNLYLAWVERPRSRVVLAVHAAGSPHWLPTTVVSSADERGSSPALRIVADRLVLAFRAGTRTMVLDYPLLVGANRPTGIQDGPDGVDPLGNSSPDDPGGAPPSPGDPAGGNPLGSGSSPDPSGGSGSGNGKH